MLPYTNASTIIEEGFQDTEDLDGLFSGWNPEEKHYDKSKGHWGYEKKPGAKWSKPGASGGITDGSESNSQPGGHGIHGYASMGGSSTHSSPRGQPTREPGGQPPRDETLQHPRCVMQLLRKHYSRYTPEMVSEICGCTPEQFLTVAETLCQNSGRERTSAFVYAVGWTQHTTGRADDLRRQHDPTAAGQRGPARRRASWPMRGHCSIQGSTDIPTLYDMLPGYLPSPSPNRTTRRSTATSNYESYPTGYWANYRKFIVSLLKAWYGDAATKENDFHFDWLPRIDDDYSQLPFFNRMAKGEVKGYFIFGQNPAGGGPNANLHRAGLRNLDWLVVLDWFQTETATFWKNDPKGPPPAEIKTEVFFIPAAPITEKEGSFTNTQRLVQWHDKAVDPEGDCRSDLWFVYNLGKRLKQLYAGSTDPKDAPLQISPGITTTTNRHAARRHRQPHRRRAGRRQMMREINGWHVDKIDPETGKTLPAQGLPGAQGRRHDGLRMLDLLRHLPRVPPQPGPRAPHHPTTRFSPTGPGPGPTTAA